MKSLINLLQRALALYAMRCLEIEQHDQTMALQHVTDVNTFRAIHAAQQQTSRDLLKARQHYIALLPPGQRCTWRTA